MAESQVLIREGELAMVLDGELRDNYLRWTESSLADMRKLQEKLTGSATDKETLDAIYGIAHNIKGMGSSFGFPLMTDTGTSFCRYLRKLEGRSADLDVIDAHIRSFDVILTNRIEGDGGEMGRDLVDRLSMMVDRALAA